MIKFVDIDTGNIYDGAKPYIHWFDGKQSTGLNYDKQFIVITDTNDLTVSIDSDVFYLVDSRLIGYETDEKGNKINKELFDKNYLDLSIIKTNSIYDNSQNVVDGYHIFSFNVIASGKYTGEVTDTIIINDEEFLIGADFDNENDALSVNLMNLGVEIPSVIQRAIYEEPIDEQKNDYALLNRKYKELLNEYINIIANKGSYKSLLNSLNWFEYGDLVKLQEYWKHSEPTKNYLSKRDLTQYINSEIESLLNTHAKTTYISINAALNKIKKENNDFVYEDSYENKSDLNCKLIDEPNPKLEDVSLLWSKEELSLKITLLGNFFSTYFMPIHLDLIQSTVENVVFASTLKISTFPKIERVDIYDEINTLRCDIDDLYHLSNVECWSYLTTLFGMEIDAEGKMNDMLGCVKEFEKISSTKEEDQYLFQHYKGVGTIVAFDCYLDNIEQTADIQSGTIVLHHNGVQTTRTSYNIKYTRENNLVKINFNLLLKEIGKYKLQLEFRKTGGIKYIKVFDFSIDENTNTELSIYRLKPRYDDNRFLKILRWIQDDGTSDAEQGVLPIDNIGQYVLDPVQYSYTTKKNQGIYTQFIATSKTAANSIHTNQVLICQYPAFLLKQLKRGKAIPAFYKFGINGSPRTKSDLIENKGGYYVSRQLQQFVWFEMPRCKKMEYGEGDIIVDLYDDDEISYLIGINTDFTTDTATKYTFEGLSPYYKLWCREMFVPYFWKLEKIGETSLYDQISCNITDEELFKKRISKETFEIMQDDVICFLPDLKYIKKPNKFNWKYINTSTNEEIVPVFFRNFEEKNDDNKNFPAILQPFFGRYDVRLLPNPGYYDVTLKYKLDDSQENDNEKTISSIFIVKK